MRPFAGAAQQADDVWPWGKQSKNHPTSRHSSSVGLTEGRQRTREFVGCPQVVCEGNRPKELRASVGLASGMESPSWAPILTRAPLIRLWYFWRMAPNRGWTVTG